MKIGNYIITVRSADEPPLVDLLEETKAMMRELILDKDREIRQLIARLARSESRSFFEAQAEQLETLADRKRVIQEYLDEYEKQQIEDNLDMIPYVDPAEMEDPVLTFENPTE